MASGLGHLDGYSARRGVDALGLVAVGIALPLRAAFVKSGLQEALALDLHRQIKGAREDPGDVARPVLDQLFQDRLNRTILPSVHFSLSMVALQLHGIPDWAALAGARPSKSASRHRLTNFQTSGYNTPHIPPPP